MVIEKIKIWVQVHPNARRNEVQGEKDGIWQLKIAAPPVRGRANQELISFLSGQPSKCPSANDPTLGKKGALKIISYWSERGHKIQ